MKPLIILFLTLPILTVQGASPLDKEKLANLKKTHVTKLIKTEKIGEAVAVPTAPLEIVQYRSPIGEMPAYVSVPFDKTKKYPAIVWLVGGFSNSIGDTSWTNFPKTNDQSASVFWKSGVVTLYPSLRGGNQNPGNLESLYGEVDDVIAAAEMLRKLPYVDPNRIYLGGHSTGGTLALLVAESTDIFRAVIAFGPVCDTGKYGQDSVTFEVNDKTERVLRAPIFWLHNINTPTYIIEGEKGNFDDLKLLQKKSTNPLLSFFPLLGKNHFETLYPISGLIAKKLLSEQEFYLTQAEIESAVGK